MKIPNLFHSTKKRFMILLEVLIALILISLCILPLVVPHVDLVNAHLRVTNSMKLDHLTNLLYADVYDRLHKNEIPWNSIQNSTVIPIDEAMLQRVGYKDRSPIKGTFKFEEKHSKPPGEEQSKQAGWKLYLKTLTFTFTVTKGASEETISFPYRLCIARTLLSDAYSTPKEETEKKEPSDDKSDDNEE